MRGRAGALAAVVAATVSAGVPVAAPASTVTAPGKLSHGCEERLLPADAPGAARTSWTAPARGYLTAELHGGKAPDWDLALFRASDGAAIAASTSFTSDEAVAAWVRPDEEFILQACRRAGPEASVPLAIDLWRGAPKRADGERFAIVSVALGDGDLARLERLGFDVTHAVEAGSAQVATYSDEERGRLRDEGFEFYPVIRDLAAADAADRLAEARAAADGIRSALPSGRDTYRLYSDYTTEMKALATANPSLVRSIEIGQTLEGRPIEGVEIAANVNSTDDGRPVFLNFGAHHAREWPSAEMPMEFALDLVARWNADDPRVRSLLDRVRVVIVPIVNVDGFLVSRNANGGIVTPIDDDGNLTIGQAFTDSGAYKRKNCRATLGDGATPCANRTGSGVDLNRNFGAYWGGPGSSTDPTSQSFRGPGPYSEPESAAVHDFTSKLHPTVFISNHTYTDGRWLRQPGFDAPFLAQVPVPGYTTADCGAVAADGGAITPDEAAMDDLGDDMAAASEPDWVSELGYETLCDITGATEDWNYFSQGTYGYTPELKGTNFHANYAQMVAAEYGDPAVPGVGVREAYLIAAERAADPAHHGVIRGTAPAGATLKLHKDFPTPTCESASCAQGDGTPIQDALDTQLAAPADGSYEWHVNPSGRPRFPSETYTMRCEDSEGVGIRQVSVARGQSVTVIWGARCVPRDDSGEPLGKCAGKAATVLGTPGADALKGTGGGDVILAGKGDDTAKGRGGDDRVCGKGGADRLSGGAGKDRLRGGGAADKLKGGTGRDRCKGGRGKDRLSSCP
jgi:murein tripeptide amidase MpaA